MGSFLEFSLGRSDQFPTRYKDQHSAVYVEVLSAGIITSFVILGLGLLATIPAYNPFLRKCLFLRIIFSLFIGGVIVVGNYGHHWEKGMIKMSAPYKPGAADEVKGKLGLHIALRGINVTLKEIPDIHEKNSTSSLKGERIDYNEHFSWEWAQGRFGFGIYAGRISREFRAGVIRGLPLPILQVAEYFTFDGEGIRFGRHYRLAGWYSHMILWFAFGTWIITNILFCLVIRSAALFLFFTGCLQLSAVAVWTFVRNPVELHIPFQTEDGKDEIILQTQYGVHYYLVFGNGIFCIILSGLITFMDIVMPDKMCQCFGIDPLTIYDELLLSKDEIKEENRRISVLQGKKFDDIEMQPSGTSLLPSGSSSSRGVSISSSGSQEGEVFLRRRSNKASFLVRKMSMKHKPMVPRRKNVPHKEHETRPLVGSQDGNTSGDDTGGSGSGYASSNTSWPPPSIPFLPPKPPPKPNIYR